GYRISQPSELSRERRNTEALQLHEQALAMYRRLSERQPEDLRFQWYIANALSNMAQRHKALRRYDVARSLWEECLQIRQDLVRRRPNWLHYQSDTAAAYMSLGWIITLMDLPPAERFEQARKHYEQAREILERF